MIATDYPQSSIVLQDTAAFVQPLPCKLVIGSKTVELVPRLIDTVDAAVVRAP